MLLDMDVPESWPWEVVNAVDEVIEGRPDLAALDFNEASSIGPDEIALGRKETAVIDEAIGDTPLALFHATRLLPHEVQSIRERGMLPLTPELVNYRLDSAIAAVDGIDSTLAERLRPAALEYAVDPGRSNQVCFSGSRLSLRKRSGFWRLFTYWGGEAIYWQLDDRLPDPALEQLSRVGTPAVVIAGFPSRGPRHGRGVRHPQLARRLVAVRLGMDPGLETHVHLVRSDEIVDVVLRGSTEWDDLEPMSGY